MVENAVPRFSVVIAAYNSAAWIVSSVRSALRQTHPAEEIIVVGDGCTDATGDILATHFGDEVRWTNLARNSGGQSTPNNEGIRLSRGTHIAYLGHDDVWSPHHLERLAGVVQAHDPDFAVSGAVFHGPPGSRFYQITGKFDDPSAASREFFPPSSLAHRRDVVDRIGPWREPGELRAGADCEFLLRAVKAGCTFASTRTITVHKFAAGHRYLSYRLPSGREQERMLERLHAPGDEARLLDEIAADIANGADCQTVGYLDFESYAPGELYRRNLATKGLRASVPALVHAPRRFGVDDAPAGLDWYPPERDRRLGPFRWSGAESQPALPGPGARRRALRAAHPAARFRRAASRVVADGGGRRSRGAVRLRDRPGRIDRACRRAARRARRRRHRRGLPPAQVRSPLERSATQARRAGARRHRGRAAGPAAAHHAYGMRSRAACESQGRSSASGCS
jgi:hypothetical protein